LTACLSRPAARACAAVITPSCRRRKSSITNQLDGTGSRRVPLAGLARRVAVTATNRAEITGGGGGRRGGCWRGGCRRSGVRGRPDP
jgi:hypothetical protein